MSGAGDRRNRESRSSVISVVCDSDNRAGCQTGEGCVVQIRQRPTGISRQLRVERELWRIQRFRARFGYDSRLHRQPKTTSPREHASRRMGNHLRRSRTRDALIHDAPTRVSTPDPHPTRPTPRAPTPRAPTPRAPTPRAPTTNFGKLRPNLTKTRPRASSFVQKTSNRR